MKLQDRARDHAIKLWADVSEEDRYPDDRNPRGLSDGERCRAAVRPEWDRGWYTRCGHYVVPGKEMCWLHGGRRSILPYVIERRLMGLRPDDLLSVLVWLRPPQNPEEAKELEGRALQLWRTLRP